MTDNDVSALVDVIIKKMAKWGVLGTRVKGLIYDELFGVTSMVVINQEKLPLMIVGKGHP